MNDLKNLSNDVLKVMNRKVQDLHIKKRNRMKRKKTERTEPCENHDKKPEFDLAFDHGREEGTRAWYSTKLGLKSKGAARRNRTHNTTRAGIKTWGQARFSHLFQLFFPSFWFRV